MKKTIAFLCALFMLLACFASCKKEKPSDPSGEILTSDLSNYTIVYGKNCGLNVANRANVLAVKLNSLYGVTVKTETDEKREPGEKEILIGYTNRTESREFLSDLRSRDYGYATVGGKLCIAGATDELTIKAIDSFMDKVLAEKSEKWELDTPNITGSEYEVDDLKINGESIRGWSVSYPSDYRNSEKAIAELIRNRILEISGFVPFLCTENDHITDKVINVSTADSDAKISVSGNRIDLCGRDAATLAQAAATLLGKFSDASVNNGVLHVSIADEPRLDEHLKIMSFNLRYDLTENAGVSRVDAAVAQIRDLSPDVLGVQEDSQQWYQLLDQKLTEYTAVRFLLPASNNEYLSVYYKTDVFTKVSDTENVKSSGVIWLSDTPTVPRSKYSESLNARGMNYVVLERKSDGAKFCFVNTHLENTTGDDSKIARQKQIKVLLEQTERIVHEFGDIPSVLVGDFNATVKEATVHGLIRESGYSDCSTDAFSITSQGTWNPAYYGDPVDQNTDTLDFCYASKNDFFICSYQVSAEQYNDMYTSDHFPILIKLLFIK